MGTAYIDGQTKPTWKLTDGVCKKVLLLKPAKREGIPETIIKRAEDLYLSVHAKETAFCRKIPKTGRIFYLHGC
ncbi:hypothetical protein SESBI_28580 [Sesbania bispinosa]|nr:hypothetical protein SESBI_28580 [Sesbania bispinosa]